MLEGSFLSAGVGLITGEDFEGRGESVMFKGSFASRGAGLIEGDEGAEFEELFFSCCAGLIRGEDSKGWRYEGEGACIKFDGLFSSCDVVAGAIEGASMS